MPKKQKKTKILIVDDEFGIRELLSDFLETAGYDVKAAKSGEEALLTANKFLPNLVMLDIILPDLDGVSVYEEIRKKENLSNVPVVFFSTVGSETVPAAFARKIKGTPCTFIRKPIKVESLIDEINKLLENSPD